jgi:hypothetical protein
MTYRSTLYGCVSQPVYQHQPPIHSRSSGIPSTNPFDRVHSVVLSFEDIHAAGEPIGVPILTRDDSSPYPECSGAASIVATSCCPLSCEVRQRCLRLFDVCLLLSRVVYRTPANPSHPPRSPTILSLSFHPSINTALTPTRHRNTHPESPRHLRPIHYE